MDTLPQVKVAVVQAAPLLFDREATVEKTCRLTAEVAAQGAQLILFPEAFIPAYPRGLGFGTVVGSRSPAGRKNILAYGRQMIERAQREVALVVGDDDELDELLPRLQEALARAVTLAVISPTPYDAGEVPVVFYPHGQSLRQVVGHGLALIVDGREMLIGEVDRSESAVWTTNGFAVALTLWCLKHEMADLMTRTRRGKGHEPI